MANYIASDADFISVADAIRTKGGTSASLSFPGGFVDAIEAFPEATTLDNLSVISNGTYTPSSGHAFGQVSVNVAGVEDSIIDRTISGNYVNSRTTNVGNYAFAHCSGLTTVSFPACTNIGEYAFRSCNSLISVNFSACTTISNYAFYNCSGLTAANFPLCTTMGSYAFAECFSLTTVSFPECVKVLEGTFNRCSNLAIANFPVCTVISNGAFSACGKLTEISFPMVKSVSTFAFFNCTKLKIVDFPVCTTIGISVFKGCSSLTTVSFPVCTEIGTLAFQSCARLLSAYFLVSSIPKLINSSAFKSTPIDGYTTSTGGVYGSIFVRASLLTAFQSATNWAYYSSRMVGLTDEEIAALEG